MQPSNLLDRVGRQARDADPFPTSGTAIRLTVIGVLLNGPNREMRRVAAPRIPPARTTVANDQAIRDRAPVRLFPRGYVRPDLRPAEDSIAIRLASTGPRPARVRAAFTVNTQRELIGRTDVLPG